MTFIWSSEELESLFEHQSEDVRNWAVSRFFDLYPDKFERVIGLLSTASEGTASRILHGLLDLNVDIPNQAPFVEVLRSSVRWDIKTLSAALLVRCGYSLLPSEIESIKLSECASALATTEQGFNILLQLYKETTQDTKLILMGIAEAGGFANLLNSMDVKKSKKEIKTVREYFGRLWRCDIPAIEEVSDSQGILSIFEITPVIDVSQNEVPWKRGLLAELEYDSKRLTHVRDIFSERATKWSDEETRFMLACILCLKRNDACRNLLIKADNVDKLWNAVVMKPWKGVPGQALRDFFLSLKPDVVLNSLSRALREEYSYAAYPFNILKTLDTPGRFELLLDVFEGKKYTDILAEEAGEALRKAGIPAAEFIIENYPRMSESLQTLIFFVLDSFPTPQVVDFCLTQFDKYMRSLDSEEFIGCLEEIASTRFLSPLVKEWREGEVEIGEAVKLISEINNIKDERIDRVIRDTEKRVRLPEDAVSKPISSFPLRCTNCGHTYRYEIKNIYVGKESKPVVGDIIQCKGCGSIETYEITNNTYIGFSANC